MRYLALAADYDGTLATDGVVAPATIQALVRLRESGRKLIMVTGRQLDDLFSCFSQSQLFDWIVAENGALLYRPSDQAERVLASSPPLPLVAGLRRRGVAPLSVGRVILATWKPHEAAALEAIRDSGLEYQVIFNKDAVMLLPAGANKSSGLAAALKELGLSRHNLVGIGDAENDHAFLSICECSVAVANAIPALQSRVDWITPADHGAGVVELIDRLLDDDLASFEPQLERHHILLGKRDTGEEVRIRPYRSNLMIAGESGGGKSTLATAFVERLVQSSYQACIVDPEGDHGSLDRAVTIGARDQAPGQDEILKLLGNLESNVVVNLMGIEFDERPRFFVSLYARLQETRAQRGSPHWLIVDEAHHVLPAAWSASWPEPPWRFDRTAFVTVDPASVAASVLNSIDSLVLVGESAQDRLRQFCALREIPLPSFPVGDCDPRHALVWQIGDRQTYCMQATSSIAERRRHTRKYAEGDLGKDRSFYFRGVAGRLNLPAQNLVVFMQLARGVDEETWLHHLHRGDYSDWFRTGIKDDALAADAEQIEKNPAISAADSLAQICELIEKQYTLPTAN